MLPFVSDFFIIVSMSLGRVIMGQMAHLGRRRTFDVSGLSGIKYSFVDFICFRLLVWVRVVSENVSLLLFLKIMLLFEVRLPHECGRKKISRSNICSYLFFQFYCIL